MNMGDKPLSIQLEHATAVLLWRLYCVLPWESVRSRVLSIVKRSCLYLDSIGQLYS